MSLCYLMVGLGTGGPWDEPGKRHLTFLSAAYVPPTLFNPFLTIFNIFLTYFSAAYVSLTLFNIECKLSQPQILWSLENRLTDYGSNLYSRRIMSSNIATLTPMTKIPTGVASFCFRCREDKTATNFRFLFSVFLSFCISAFQVGLPNCQFLFMNFGFL